ncbi:MAG TPA: ABC transporter permease subunit [Anaerovoracaceae bacterium]|nr:ABC transporter permease subunit [Anaerovoracaceae bacterium]
MDRKYKIKVWAIIFWLILWESVAYFNSDNFLFVSIFEILKRFYELALTEPFWNAVLTSSVKILMGIFLSFMLAIITAPLAYRFIRFKELLNPLLITIKSVPVASFIIFALVFISSSKLSILISLLIGYPIIYTNILNGMEDVDVKMLEMAKIFNITGLKKIIYIFVPLIRNDFKSGLNLAVGMCWKAGVAAEVIGIPIGTLGEGLYISKLQLDTAGIMAYTLSIVILSIIFEKLIVKSFDITMERIVR